MTYELGIIGAGNMAQAIVTGVVRAGALKADQIIAANHNAQRLADFAKATGVKTTQDNRAVVSSANVILLAVKPQKMTEVLADLSPAAKVDALFVSVATGISTNHIQQTLGGDRPWRVIRTMPNTPMAVGEGAVGMCRGSHATDVDVTTVRRLFEPIATVVEVAEDKIDAVTALSGSGPAYFFFLVEQMVKAGVELGLTHEQAVTLAAKTAQGAGKMLTQSPDIDAAELRRRVTSPNGTTHAAITSLQTAGFGQAVVHAVKAAARRAKELSK